jgi:UDP-2-acetamido-2-deoxy-ribo-hexuluronate aminotransferase
MKIKLSAAEAQYEAHKKPLQTLMLQSMENRSVIGSESTEKLEKALATYVGTDEAIVCNNQFNAFVLLFMCLGLKAGDEVITSPLATGVALEAIFFMGGRPVFVDIGSSYTVDVAQIEDAITERTKIIIPVSLFGRCPEMESINALALQHDICVIEDAGQSFGSDYHGLKSCALSKLAAASFHPEMPLSAYGNGAALFIQDADLRAKARKMLALGKEGDTFTYIGIDAALDEIQATLLAYKLTLFDDELQQRKRIYKRYCDALGESSLILPETDSTGNFAYYPVRTPEPGKLAKRLREAGIESRQPFDKPLHLHEAFRTLDYKKGDFPVAEKAAKELLLLPIHAYLGPEEQEKVIAALLNG